MLHMICYNLTEWQTFILCKYHTNPPIDESKLYQKDLPTKIKSERDDEHDLCELVELGEADYAVTISDDVAWV